MATYFWIEDRVNKSGYTFWNELLYNLFPSVILESKENNSELLKAVTNISDNNNTYIIVYDHSFDNPQIIREIRLLRKNILDKSNVIELDIISFKYVLLEFEKLIDWIYAPDDEFLSKRKQIIVAREKLLKAISQKADYKSINEIRKYVESVDEYNIEQLAAKMLFDLTRNTGFEVTKGKLGPCWCKDCCKWIERQENDFCGLDDSKISAKEKMKDIYYFTSLSTELQKCGLGIG